MPAAAPPRRRRDASAAVALLWFAGVAAIVLPPVGVVLAFGSVLSIWEAPSEEQVRSMYPPLYVGVGGGILCFVVCAVVWMIREDDSVRLAGPSLTGPALVCVVVCGTAAGLLASAYPLPLSSEEVRERALVQQRADDQRTRDVARSEDMNRQAEAERQEALSREFLPVTQGTERDMDREASRVDAVVEPLSAKRPLPTPSAVRTALIDAAFAPEDVDVVRLGEGEPRVVRVIVRVADGCVESHLSERDSTSWTVPYGFSRRGDCTH